MNVLDGVRHLNQSIMEDVSRQFGADGVEIDAHPLCAPDHLPYQGGQYTNAEFDEIQNSLSRPFGEWNCRHTWSPILLGISRPAYSPEQLDAFERYSTDEVEIDGVTRTRYEWSQQMRRVEARMRAEKDTATLARYAGLTDLRRQCQGAVDSLMRQYERLSEKAGLDPEYRRLYVAGFRDASAEKNRLQGSSSRGIINIEVDEMTPCLRKNATGELVDTTVQQISPSKTTCKGWEFDWTRPERFGYNVYALRVKGERVIQGMIAMKDDPSNYAVNIDIVEAAPQNNPHNPRNKTGKKEYNGVGGHLFAEACRRSFENGYGGFVYFTAKTNLIRHYQEELGAVLINPGARVMAIDGNASLRLVNRYYGGDK